MRKNFLSVMVLLCTLLFLNISCKKDDPVVPAGPATTNVSILAMSYSPASVTVPKGSIVKWTNNGGTTHTVTSDDGISFNSGNITVGSSISLTTASVGTFPYHCLIHGTSMAGTLIVTN